MQVTEKDCDVIARDVRSTLSTLDDAVDTKIELLRSLLQMSRKTEAPLEYDQPIFEECAEGINNLIGARRNVTRMISKMNRIKGETPLKTYDVGCKDGPVVLPSSGSAEGLHLVSSKKRA